jgi:hypothetical protein
MEQSSKISSNDVCSEQSSKTFCFICFQDETSENFINQKVCKCNGSLKLHESCYFQLREHDDTCKICKTKYPKLPPKFINGLAEIKIFADDYSPFDIFYTIDINNKKQGVETWYEDKVIKIEIDYVNGIKHGLEKHYEYGSVCSIIPYENGKIHGIVKGFVIDRSRVDNNGNFVSVLHSETTYEYGVILKDSKKFYDVVVNQNINLNTGNLF